MSLKVFTDSDRTDVLTCAAWVVDPDVVVWRGDWALPPSQQAHKVLGVRIGHPSFITVLLERTSSLRMCKSGGCCSFFVQPP